MSSDGPDPSASGSDAAEDPLIGEILDKRYRLTRKLGEGGMGEVYAADHMRTSHKYAIKLLRAEVLTNEEAVARFEQEAMTASSIRHENIIQIADSGKLDDGRIYLAMELLDGLPFNDLIEQPTPIPANRLLNILIQTCHGLAAAHSKNIVHRDMKPENIYITQKADGSDLPKLLDFGIAKVSQAEGENHLTRTGTIFGTPFYMAPEQALGQAVDHRVDIYAMGVIMYEVFCGVVPFGGESFMGILTQHITAEPVLPSLTAQQNGRVLPPGVEDVIVRAMKKEPAQRYQSMEELVDALVPIYRNVAGAGMSTYMEAHVPDAALMGAGTRHPTPPQSGGYSAAGASPAHTPGHDTGQPYQQGHDTGQPYQQQQMGTAPPNAQYGAQASGSYAGASASMVTPAKKSNTGLIVGILLALCAAGGGAIYFLVMNNGGEKSDPVAVVDPGDPGETGETGETGANVGTVETIDAGSAGATDPIPEAVTVDAAVAVVAPDAKTAVKVVKKDPVVPPKPAMVEVKIKSRPKGAILFREGKKIGRSFDTVEIPKGKTVNFVLKKPGFKDLAFSLDGNKKRFVGRLVSKGGGTTTKPDKPPVDPCKLNPNLPRCMLE